MAAPIPDAVEYLWEKLHELEPSTELGGIYAFKSGYHSTRKDNKNNWPGNYSIVDPQDQGGPDNLAAALDWTFPDAQSGHYDLIIKYSKRLLDSGKDVNDSRLDWMREFYGQADKDTQVEGWDFRYAVPASSDPSHLWHLHFSFSRNALTTANMDKLLEVLTGDDMTPEQTANAVWHIDGEPAINNKYFPWRSDSPSHDPAPEKPNEWITGGTALIEAAMRADLAYETAEALTAKVDQILAILQSGVPVPGAVNLTPEAQAAVADAVADEVSGRLKE